MGSAGKALSAIGGILVIVASFVFALDVSTGNTMTGLNAIINFMNLINPLDIIALVLAILFILSPILILIGIKSRATSIIGAIIPLVLGLWLVLGVFITLPIDLLSYFEFLDGYYTVMGIIPMSFELIGMQIGALLLLVGGLLALIGGIMGRD